MRQLVCLRQIGRIAGFGPIVTCGTCGLAGVDGWFGWRFVRLRTSVIDGQDQWVSIGVICGVWEGLCVFGFAEWALIRPRFITLFRVLFENRILHRGRRCQGLDLFFGFLVLIVPILRGESHGAARRCFLVRFDHLGRLVVIDHRHGVQ